MTSSVQNSNSSKPILENQITERHSMDSQYPPLVSDRSELTIALLPWGDLFEDHFDPLGVSLETFRNEFTGSYQFGYIEALRLAGVRTVLFYVSARISTTLRFTHIPSGTTVCVLPASKIHRAYRACRSVRRRMLNLDGEFSNTHSAHDSHPSLLTSIKSAASSIGTYLSTPLGLLARELRREGCDAILCQEYEYARFDTCVLLGQLMRLPVFATFQGGNKQQSFVEYPVRSLALRKCTSLIIATQTEMTRVRTCYKVPSTKMARIFNPVDVEAWRAIDRNEARAGLEIPINARVVVWHGRVEIERKGLDVLLEAWDQICCQRPETDLRLLLVGTGSNANELHQRITNMELRGVLRVDEFVNDRTVIQRYLSAADVYTLPSRHEGFPVAPVEAMACGLPVVATDAPGVLDIFQAGEASGGLIVPRNDVQALASALDRVLDDEVWGRELGKLARHRAEECFSLLAIGKQLRNFLLSQKAPLDMTQR